MSLELFDPTTFAMLSPRLAWRKRHGVQTLHNRDFEDDAEYLPWISWLASDCSEPDGIPNCDPESCGYGKSEDEAMCDLAVKRNIRLWNEEVAP
jgi:hypothetical protein